MAKVLSSLREVDGTYVWRRGRGGREAVSMDGLGRVGAGLGDS